ncbi:MAG: MBL fold metallo-hydrolase [Lachnospiraceae bacterium]|nr:MBL fold metallo-hydrolase [Lachnospiraceae bacterium]
MRIQQIRNATLKIIYGDSTFLLDPWLQDRGTGFSALTVRSEMKGVKSPLNELPMPPEEILNGVDYCLVTHIHPDHFTENYLPKNIKIMVQNDADLKK